MSNVAVFGCGPAGLLAAHAVALADHNPIIYSKDVRPSPHARAVYLHTSIPDVSSADPDDFIIFQKRGRPEGYALKVYGDEDAPTSWSKFKAEPHEAWALGPIYEALWRLYSGSIEELEINYEEALDITGDFELVINTAPLPSLCAGTCNFPSRKTWVKPIADIGVEYNTMVYSGSPLDGWYRSSNLFGTESTEYAREVEGASPGIKVLPTDCDCLHRMVRAGRWGSWKPGVLLHHAFEEAHRAVSEL